MTAIKLEDIKPGDRVTLEHPDGSRLVDREVNEADQISVPGGVYNWPLLQMAQEGWTITDHKPRVALPTERGWYLGHDKMTNLPLIAVIRNDGGHLRVTSSAEPYGAPLGDPERFAPFARLVERDAAIREVLDWLWYDDMLAHDDRLAAERHFGVTR